MPKEQGILRRLLVKACPQFLEDWVGEAGVRFRQGMKKVSKYNSEHVRIGDKIDEAPGMLWRAAEGAASAQHAKAESDYAKAENDRVDAELRRRTLDPRTRHEWADADKAEAEAGIAKIREIQARIELFKQLREIGVAVTMDEKITLKVTPGVHPPLLDVGELLTSSDQLPVQDQWILVRAPKDLPKVSEVRNVVEFKIRVGSRVRVGDPVADITVMSSPITTYLVKSPVGGVVTFVPVSGDRVTEPDQPICTILTDPS